MGGTLIIGGGGMIGHKLAKHLHRTDPDTALTLFDLHFPPEPIEGAAQITGNVAGPDSMASLAKARYDTIFYLASIVSGEAETNFDLGWNVNLHPMIAFLEGLRAENLASDGSYRPKVIFTSSIAVFGGPFPETIPDNFAPSPQTSYGAQKLMCEALVQDYSRKGFIDGLSLRLPTICVRPGKANKAASSFFSGIIREPLNGQPADLPVPDTVRHWFASPQSAVGFLDHAARLDTALLNGHRALNLPGVACTVADQIAALRAVAGQKVADLIRPKPDPAIAAIIANWPECFSASRAKSLGFVAEASFEDIIRTYIAEDLQAT